MKGLTMPELVIITEPAGIRGRCNTCKKVLREGICAIVIADGEDVAFVCEKRKCNDCNVEGPLPITFDSVADAFAKANELNQEVSSKGLSALHLLRHDLLTFRYIMEKKG